MEFGILFTSHPNTDTEPYPHRDVHARVTREILRADEIGFDYAWVAEHHFSNQHGIMPDVFVYAAYLAALTTRIKIGTAVAARKPAARGGKRCLCRHVERRPLRAGAWLRLSQIRVRWLRRRFQRAPRHPGGSPAAASGTLP